MSYDSTSWPARVTDIVSGAPEPPAGATPQHRRMVVHPLAVLLGWPAVAVPTGGPPRPPRRRLILRRRECER
jgi:hypothetical protein